MKDIEKKILSLASDMKQKIVERRRDIHRHPETGWTEFRTASIVINQLRFFGYEVSFGRDVMEESERMGVPPENTLRAAMERAVAEGADPDLVNVMEGGYTGVVGVMDFGAPGKTVALRFDMDCNDVMEAAEEKHRPFREGFASRHSGLMHACGHDGHTTAGLAIAEILSKLRGELRGKVKFIFQPAEEGVRGARAMTAKGVVDDTDFLLGAHLLMPKVGYLGYDVSGFYATTKFDADFEGVPAHAAGFPEKGKNALLAAATAALNLHAIPRTSKGSTRVNVGVLNAGSGRNVVPGSAHMEIETRGSTSEANDFVFERAQSILQGAAAIQDVTVKLTRTGGAASGRNTPELSAHVKEIAERLGIFDELAVERDLGGSEDCSYFMERVQKLGGQAAYLIIGGSLAAVNHNNYFDFDEEALVLEVQLIASVTAELLAG